MSARRKAKATKERRGDWVTNGGLHRMTLGERKGGLLHIRQKRPGGVFFVRVWVNKRYSEKSLRTREPELAKERARAFQSALSDRNRPAVPNVVELGALWRRFSTECKPFARRGPDYKKDAAAHARVLIGHFTPHFDVGRITQDDVDGFVDARAAGGIVTGTDENGQPIKTEPGSERTAEADLVWLNHMLIWATTTRLPHGMPWLTSNPLKPLAKPHPKSQMRPHSSQDRYEATLRTLDEQVAKAADDLTRSRWMQIRLFLVLAAATGRRLSAIRQLLWSDIDFTRKLIHWRAKTDKKGKLRWIPLSDTIAAEFRRYREQYPPVTSEWVFPAEKNAGKPSDRYLFRDWMIKAERYAELPKLEGGLWHPFRRMWAMCRKDMPIRDVMEVGGWDDFETILKYMLPDHGTMLRVLEEAPVLRDGVGLVREERVEMRDSAGA